MKHPLSPTILLVILFVCSQLIGLAILTVNATVAVDEDGVISVDNTQPITGDRPETTEAGIFMYLVIGIAIGTAALLIMAKFKATLLWKLWYMLAIALTVATAFGVLLPAAIAWIIGVLAAVLKVYKPHSFIHNITEIFIHAGIAFIIVPLLNVFWAIMMLIAIAVYDAYAVWKSKHMVDMANFMTDTKLFAGLNVPYNKKKGTVKVSANTKASKKTTTVRTAILGGGDIAFPLLFSGTVLLWLIGQGLTKTYAFGLTTIITVSATIALIGLFVGAKKDHFYPAMPFLSSACLIGLGIIVLIV